MPEQKLSQESGKRSKHVDQNSEDHSRDQGSSRNSIICRPKTGSKAQIKDYRINIRTAI